jgi:hypothetical protein
MDWRILVFYPEPEARDKFTNIRQSMLKLKRVCHGCDLMVVGFIISYAISDYQQ